MSGAGRPEAAAVDASGLSLGVVAARWNGQITDQLLERALAAAKECGLPEPVVVRVAGALELPVVAQQLARDHDAVVCLGCVIRGETPHFEYISAAVAHGLMQASGETGVPMAFGVLTTDSWEQAEARAGDSRDNKGFEAAAAALEMAELFGTLRAAARPSESERFSGR